MTVPSDYAPYVTMKLILVLTAAAIVLADEHGTNSECEPVTVHGKTHIKELLASGLNRPYQLSIYEREHKIFFSYNVGKNEEDTFEIAYIERGKQNVTIIPAVPNGFASAVDEVHHVAYLGGSTGIFKYHLNKKKHQAPEKIIGKYNIWSMFFKKHLYFINFPSQKLYKYNTSNSEAVPEHQKHITEKIYQFVIDKDDDQFVTTENGLYRIKHGSNERTLYSNIKLFRGVALNHKGHAHFCGNHSIYEIDKKTHTLEEIASVRNVFGITFDAEDNIIYSDPNQIIKLLPGDCK